MVLPSQASRVTSSRSHMYRRRRSNRWWAAGAIVAIAGAGVWLIGPFGGGEEADASEIASPGGAGGDPATPASNADDRRSEDRGGTAAINRPTAAPGHSQPANPVDPDRRDVRSNPTDTATDRTRATAPTRTEPTTPRTEERPAETRPTSLSDRLAGSRISAALALLPDRPVEARRRLSALYFSEDLGEAEAEAIRRALSELNERLVFSPHVEPDDPFSRSYTVVPGDSLSRIASRQSLLLDWRFVQRINDLSSPRALRAGQTLKLITGPFHLVVDKSAYRADLYLGDGAERVYVRSFPVGLGEFGSTPVGAFRVRTNSKLINPEWVNPRTGERYLADDPENPIGERWIGLEGVDENTVSHHGYGIHGTIDLDSIGKQRSMGCIRMRPDDIAIVYELLAEGASVIEIRP